MGKSFWKELWVLLVYVFLGIILTFVGALFFLLIDGIASKGITGMSDNVLFLHALQWMQTIFVMFLPPLIWYKTRVKRNAFKDFGFYKFDWKFVGLAFVYVVLSQPAMEIFQIACHNIPWPDAIKESFQEAAMANYEVMCKLMNLDSVAGWIEVVLLVSISTAIAEETMFRGGLFKCFGFTKLNKHWTAIFIGLIFSAIHFEPEGFIVRWILGTIFCYFVYWSGSIWPAIIGHAVNNFMAILQFKFTDTGNPFDENTYTLTFGWTLSLISVVVTMGLIYYMQKVAAKTDKIEEPEEE